MPSRATRCSRVSSRSEPPARSRCTPSLIVLGVSAELRGHSHSTVREAKKFIVTGVLRTVASAAFAVFDRATKATALAMSAHDPG